MGSSLVDMFSDFTVTSWLSTLKMKEMERKASRRRTSKTLIFLPFAAGPREPAVSAQQDGGEGGGPGLDFLAGSEAAQTAGGLAKGALQTPAAFPLQGLASSSEYASLRNNQETSACEACGLMKWEPRGDKGRGRKRLIKEAVLPA